MLTLAAMRLGGSVLSGYGRSAKLLILTYHRVLPEDDALLAGTVDAATFEWQMSLLAERFNVLPLTEAATRLRVGGLPSRAVSVTFDDGYADNVSVALPILQRYGLTATFFIATGFLDGGRMWNDTVIESVRRAHGDDFDLHALGLDTYSINDAQARCRTIDVLLGRLKYRPIVERARMAERLAEQVGECLPNDLMMTTEQVLQLQTAGMEVGAHTVNHPILTQLSAEQSDSEIREARSRLLQIGIKRVAAFAYPNGRPGAEYDRGHVDIVRRVGFEVAVSTAWGCARSGMDPLQLPRVAPWDRTPARFYVRMLTAYIRRSIKSV